MRSDWFNAPNRTDWPLFTSIEDVRAKFAPGTAIMVAIGGWGDTSGFDAAARTEENRALFAENVRKMLEDTGADGIPFFRNATEETMLMFFSRRGHRLGIPGVRSELTLSLHTYVEKLN